MKTIISRVDGDHHIGTGHVMRMLALAQAWQRRGGAVVFCCVLLPHVLQQKLAATGIEVIRLEVNPGSADDAESVVRIAKDREVVAIACDNYHFTLPFQKIVSSLEAQFLVVVDYPVAEPFDCDIILNQNLGSTCGDFPAVAAASKVLIGPTFTLLRQEFVERRADLSGKKISPNEPRKILVTFGGADPHNTTTKVIDILGRVADNEAWEVKVVVGGANLHLAEIERLVMDYSSIELLFDVADMSDLIDWCDLAISAAGSTVWELCLFGVPMVLISIAENQNGIIQAMDAAGAAINLGVESEIESSNLERAVREIILDVERWNKMASCAESLVDGAGADRVAAALDANLRISLVTAGKGWVRGMLSDFVDRLRTSGHKVTIVYDVNEIPEGDIALFLSCWSLVPPEILSRSAHNLVVHASDLPAGKGWSPMTWQIIEGKNLIPLTLFEAQATVDSGRIYSTDFIEFEGHELLQEMRVALMEKSYQLCERFIENYPEVSVTGKMQSGEESFYRRRESSDSQLEADQSIASQFNLLRTVDNDYYPAFFNYQGCRYKLRIEKSDEG